MARDLARWDAGYVGMTFIPAGSRVAHGQAASRSLARLGARAHVESAILELAPESAARAVFVSGHGWLEIDDVAERERAEEALWRLPWWG